MPKGGKSKKNKGGGGGGGPPSWLLTATRESMRNPQSFADFLAYLNERDGDYIRITIGGDQYELNSPVTPETADALKEEIRTAPRMMGTLSLVVRKSHDYEVAEDPHYKVRHYTCLGSGYCKLPPEVARYSNNHDAFSGAFLGDEPNVEFE